MKSNAQKLFALLLILAAIFMLTGCENANELNDLVVVLGIGFDQDEQNPQNIKLVAQVVLPSNITFGSASSGSGEKPFCNVESAAGNTFEAVREFTHVICNKLYISHNQLFVISKDVARRGIVQYLDFFMRAKETRPTTVIVVTDQTAAEVLDVEPKMNIMPAINITQLVLHQVNNSQSMETTVLDYLNAMQSDTASFLAPMVSIEYQDDKPLIFVKGLAVFVKDKMVGQLDEDETRGLLWVVDKVKTGTINVVVKGQEVSVDIVSSKTNIKSEVNGDAIIMNIAIDQKGTLAHQSGSENLATGDCFALIEEQVRLAINHEITLSFNKAKELGADIYGFGELLHKYHYKEWQTMSKNWADVFPDIELNVTVEATIVGSGTLTNSVQGKE